MQTLYRVMAPSDTTEGRGPLRSIVTLTRREVADALANEPKICRKFGVMGYPTPLRVDEIQVCEGLEEALEYIKKVR